MQILENMTTKERFKKLKAFDKKNNRIVCVDSIEFIDKIEGRTGCNVFVENDKPNKSYWLEESEFELMEYAGLNDSYNSEIYTGHELMMITKNSQSSMTVEFEDGCFVGVGPFNTHPLKTYFNSPDFISMEITGNIHEKQKQYEI
jgi:YopX protein